MIQVVVIAIFVGIAAASHNGYNENDTGLRWCFGSWRSRRFGSHAFTDHGAASNGCILDCWNIKAYRYAKYPAKRGRGPAWRYGSSKFPWRIEQRRILRENKKADLKNNFKIK